MARKSGELNEKQRRFALEYLKDLNATQAAKRAGYSPRTAHVQGHALLKNPKINEVIEAEKKARETRTAITVDRVVEEIGKVAFANMEDYLEFGQAGVRLYDSKKLTRDQLAAVAEASEVVTKDGGSIKFKLHSKLDALEKLMKHVGAYKPGSAGEGGDQVINLILVDEDEEL